MAAAWRRSWRTVAGLILTLFLAALGAALFFPLRGVGHEGPDEDHRPIAQPDNPVELQIALGIKDSTQDPWKGELKVSGGKVLDLSIVQAARDSTTSGATFTVTAARQPAAQKKANKAKKNAPAQNDADAKQPATKKNKKKQQAAAAEAIPLVPARLRALLDAPDTAKVTVETGRGSFTFTLADIPAGQQKEFLDGQASVIREPGALKLTAAETEDDFPAMARGADGSIWLAYVAYRKGPEIVAERMQAGNFAALVTKGNGDEIRLMRFDGKTWRHEGTASEPGIDVWRPTIAVDGDGGVVVAWAQPLNDDWNILAQRFQPAKAKDGKGKWGEIQVVTDAKGSDFHVVATTDSQGKVWLAWQGWRGDNYDILLCDQHPTAGWSEPKRISHSPRNDWSPTIAADGKGRVFVAWDTYDRGNYDVHMHVVGAAGGAPLVVADSSRFEARASLVCDKQNRVWVAYEEGDEQWGKDYASDNQFRNVGLSSNPGFALYVNRTVKLRCLVDEKWLQPAADVSQAFGSQLTRNKSLPRLMGDASGGLWLLLRHHPLAGGAGEAWHSYALRFNGAKWSEPKHLPSSANLLDNRPALAAQGDGVLAVYSSDSRTNTASRGQDDLYAVQLTAEDRGVDCQLVAVPPNPPAELAAVHDNEGQVVQRLRAFRINVGGKPLQLVRGEFHRHTEYTSHRDQDGLLEDSWRYSLDAGHLDWMGNGDHDNGTHEYMWWTNQKQSDLHHNPPHFVAAMTYERSLPYPNGHRNVIMPRRGIRPLPRGDMTSSPETGTADTKMLYAYLKHFGAICAVHTSGTNMGTDWRDNDPEVEPIVEIYQGHRHNYEHFGAPRSATAQTQIGGYQPAGFIWNALEKGYKLGFQSSSDHVSTHMSYAMVFAPENSRQATIDAFKQRHCYGATDNILLVVRSGEHLMGDIFTTHERPQVSIEAVGGKPLTKVSIVRDNKYVYSNEPNSVEVRREYTDMDVKPGETHYYYVRVEQSDGNLAWASPMWITYQP